MTEVLLIAGVIVFFITVCGAIMVGGHLLEELARSESTPEDAPAVGRSVVTASTTPTSS